MANVGMVGLDWQERINWDRLRKYRLERARERMKAHGLGALLLSTPIPREVGVLAVAAMLRVTLAVELGRALFWAGGLVTLVWRWLALRPRTTSFVPKHAETTPEYTVLAPLFSEPELVEGLISHLRTLDYPADKLEIVALIQDGDEPTAAVVRRFTDSRLILVRVPAAGRAEALNAGLAVATGTYVAVFDPENRPHPAQLLEAAERFSTGPATLACLQSPIRLGLTGADSTALTPHQKSRAAFTGEQLRAEYSVLYESTLPLLAALKAPFPLGDSSCHFRADVLRRIGGWAPGQAAEDAEIAYRFARGGYIGGVLSLPTGRAAPADVHAWLPQKTRWIKGHLQILAGHLSRPRGLGRLGVLSLIVVLGLGVGAAIVQGPLLALLAATLFVAALQGVTPVIPAPEALLLAALYLTAVRARQVASRAAGAHFGWRDAAFLPFRSEEHTSELQSH